jgi:hypothetical protein
MSGAVPLPPLCAFMACYRVTFTLSSLVNWWIFWFVPSLSSHFDTRWSKSGYGVDSVIVRTVMLYYGCGHPCSFDLFTTPRQDRTEVLASHFFLVSFINISQLPQHCCLY